MMNRTLPLVVVSLGLPGVVAAQTAPTPDNVAKIEDPLVARAADDVNAEGAFNITIPFDLPPGRRGIAPSLSLSYSSHRGNGLVGVGFSLRGLPAIVPVNFGDGIDYDGDDDYALVSGGWGDPPSLDERLVEKAPDLYVKARNVAGRPLAEIEAVGRLGAAGTGGPCYFVLRDGSGTRTYFGGDETVNACLLGAVSATIWDPSRQLAAWSLYKVIDVHGNAYRVDYYNDGRTIRPRRVRYTLDENEIGEGGASREIHEVEFEYGPRPDVSPMPAHHDQRLTHVFVRRCAGSACSPIRTYSLTYERSPTSGRSRLTRVRELGSDFATAAPDRTFIWSDTTEAAAPGTDPLGPMQEYPYDLEETGWTWWMNSSTLVNVDWTNHVGDINGDGWIDVVRVFQGLTDFNGRYAGDYPVYATLIETVQGAPLMDGVFLAPVKHTHLTTPIDDYDGAPLGGHHTGWSSILGDVNGDGRDDVLIYRGRGDSFRLAYALGSSTASGGLEPLVEWPQWTFPTILTAEQVDAFVTALGDINGDQRLDLVVFNHSLNQFFHALGEPTGLGPMNTGSLPIAFAAPTCTQDPDNPQCVDFQDLKVADFDGDGYHDAVAVFSAGRALETAGEDRWIRWSYAFGDETAPLASGNGREQRVHTAFVWPHDVGVGDLDGNGAADLLLSRTGEEEFWSHRGHEDFQLTGRFVEHGRDVRILFGGSLGSATTDRVLEDNGWHYPFPTGYPGLFGPPASHNAYVESVVADLDGDGISDSLQAYRGFFGTRIERLIVDPGGSFGGGAIWMDPYQPYLVDGCPQTSPLDPTIGCQDSAGGYWADGLLWPQFYKPYVADLNGDGNTDFVLAYHGWGGLDVYYALGSSDRADEGLQGSLESVSLCGTAPAAPMFCDYHYSTMHFVDLNQDGRDDLLVIPTSDPFNTASSQPRSAFRMRYALSTLDLGDLLVQVENGLGGDSWIEYVQPNGMFGPIRDELSTCAGPSGEGTLSGPACGHPDTAPRPLVKSVTTSNGRGLVATTSYEYHNGRYLPGALASRARLGFERVVKIHEETGRRLETVYRQDPPFDGLAHEERDFADPCWTPPAATTASCPALMRRVRHTYQDRRPLPGVELLAETLAVDEKHEMGALVGSVSTQTSYDAEHVIAEVNVCSSDPLDPCTRTRYGYTHDPDGARFGLGRWVMGRIDSITVTRPNATSETIVDMTRTMYDVVFPIDPVRRERILFPSYELAACAHLGDPAHDLETCQDEVVAGEARWVAFERDVTYDEYGNRTGASDALGARTTWTYDAPTKTHVATTANDLGHVESRFYDVAGRITQIVDPNGQATNLTYDRLGRIKTVTPPGIAAPTLTTWEYADLGVVDLQRAASYTTPGASGASHDVEDYFDGFGRTWKTVEHAGAIPRAVLSSTTFVDGERIERTSHPFFAAGAPLHWNEVRHDAAGRPYLEQRVDSAFRAERELAQTTYHTDGSITVTNALGQSRRSWFNPRGLLVGTTDAMGNDTNFLRDAGDRVTAVSLRESSSLSSRLVTTRHDGWGRRVCHSDTGGTMRWRYDDAGRVIASRDANGQTVRYTYDSIGRLESETGASPIASYTYDEPGHGFSIGRVTGVLDRSGSTELHYDARGNVTRKDMDVGSSTSFSYAYAWDGADRLIEKTFPVGRPDQATQTYVRAADGAIEEIWHAGRQYVDHAQFDEYRQVTSASFYWDTASGRWSSTTTFGYDPEQRITTINSLDRAGTGFLQLTTYDYDLAGNLVRVNDLRPSGKIVGGVNTDRTQTFTYDDLNRLRTAAGVYGSRGYDYDGLGNRTRFGDGTYVQEYLSVGDHTQIVGRNGAIELWSAEHDAAGDRISMRAGGNEWSYVYDENHRLVEVWNMGSLVEELVYDYTGKRVRKVFHGATATLTTYYVGEDYEVRTSSADPTRAATTHRVAGVATITGGDLLPGQPSEAAVAAAANAALSGDTTSGPAQGTWIHLPDLLDSVGVTIRASDGVVVSRAIYEPWGNVDDGHSLGLDAHTRKFTGQELDEEVDLYHYGARYYDPITARFITADTLVPAGDPGDVQAYNRFAYVMNNPTRYRDPSGHAPEGYKPTPHQKAQALREAESAFRHLKRYNETGDPAHKRAYDLLVRSAHSRMTGSYHDNPAVALGETTKKIAVEVGQEIAPWDTAVDMINAFDRLAQGQGVGRAVSELVPGASVLVDVADAQTQLEGKQDQLHETLLGEKMQLDLERQRGDAFDDPKPSGQAPSWKDDSCWGTAGCGLRPMRQPTPKPVPGGGDDVEVSGWSFVRREGAVQPVEIGSEGAPWWVRTDPRGD